MFAETDDLGDPVLKAGEISGDKFSEPAEPADRIRTGGRSGEPGKMHVSEPADSEYNFDKPGIRVNVRRGTAEMQDRLAVESIKTVVNDDHQLPARQHPPNHGQTICQLAANLHPVLILDYCSQNGPSQTQGAASLLQPYQQPRSVL